MPMVVSLDSGCEEPDECPESKSLDGTHLSIGERYVLARLRRRSSKMNMAISQGMCLGEYISVERDLIEGPFISVGDVTAEELAAVQKERFKNELG